MNRTDRLIGKIRIYIGIDSLTIINVPSVVTKKHVREAIIHDLYNWRQFAENLSGGTSCSMVGVI